MLITYCLRCHYSLVLFPVAKATLSLLWFVSLPRLSWSPYQWLLISDSVSVPLVMLLVTIVTSCPRLRLYCSLYGLPFTQTRIYTSLLAPLWWQVESPVSFPKTETLLPISFLPSPSVGPLSGTQSTTLSRLYISYRTWSPLFISIAFDLAVKLLRVSRPNIWRWHK
jgi:hypothetical protein